MVDIDFLRHLPDLEVLALSAPSKIERIDALRGMRALRFCLFERQKHVQDWRPLTGLPDTTNLHLMECGKIELEAGWTAHPALRNAEIHNTDVVVP